MFRRGLHSIHNRLFLLFLFCMLSLLLILSFLYYQRTTDQFQSKIGDIGRKNMSQTVELYNLLLQSYDSMTKSVSNNLDLQRLLTEPTKDAAVKAINERTITNMLATVYYSREDVVGIHIMSNAGAIYSYENYLGAVDEQYLQSAWYSRIHESSGEMVWVGVHTGSLIDPTLKRTVFSFGRQLYDFLDHKPIGMLLIEVDAKSILSGMENLRLGEHSEVFFLDGNGKMMATTTGSAVLPDSLKTLEVPQKVGQVMVEQRPDWLIVSAKPTLADWTMVSMTPDSDLNVELQQTKHFLLIVVSLLIILATALATFVSRTISKPLKRLISEMKQVEMGNFRGVLNVKSYEEINVLVASFNQMVLRMDELIDRVKLSSISEKNAQLQALQSQVNPHFLYNTLDMIYWMLDEKENDRLGKVVLSLSHMFRYSSSWEDNAEVTLREELTQVRHYLTIIENRLEGRFAAELDVDEAWQNMKVPKMTLQPIIENAVKHGLEPLQDRTGILRVFTRATSQGLEIVVEDNGVGMDPAVLKHLQNSFDELDRTVPREHQESYDQVAASSFLMSRSSMEAGTAGEAPFTKARRGIGLYNLQRRLVHMFGKNYGILVDSRKGEGTTVVAVLPLSNIPVLLGTGGVTDGHINSR